MSYITQELIDAINAGAQRNAEEGVSGFREGEDAGNMVRVDQYMLAAKHAAHPDVVRQSNAATSGPIMRYVVI